MISSIAKNGDDHTKKSAIRSSNRKMNCSEEERNDELTPA
jgi:hypothetical protein